MALAPAPRLWREHLTQRGLGRQGYGQLPQEPELPWNIPLHPPATLKGEGYYCPHFKDEDIEAYRGQVTGPKPHS